MKTIDPVDSGKVENHGKRMFLAEELEGRILYSGSPAPVAVDAAPTESFDLSVAKEDFSGGFVAIEEVGQGLDLSNEEFVDDLPAVNLLSFQNLSAEEIAELKCITASVSASTEIDVSASMIPEVSFATAVTLDQVELMAEEAMQRWITTGLSEAQIEALSSIEYRVADLGAAKVGKAEGNVITIDINAAAKGWFIDATPELDDEFLYTGDTQLEAATQEAEQGIDLLTVLMHEQGHILGLLDESVLNQEESLMYRFIEEGKRRIAAVGQADGALAGSLEGAHYAGVTLYDADFSNDGDGFADHTTGNTPAAGSSVGPFGSAGNQWSLTTGSVSSDGSANSFSVDSGALIASDWGGEGTFLSQSIDIAGVDTISISAIGETVDSAVQNAGTEFFEYFYILDGGSESATSVVLSGDSQGTPVNYTIASLDVSTASTLQVGYRFNVNGGRDGYSISSFTVEDISGGATLDGEGSVTASNAAGTLSGTPIFQRNTGSQEIDIVLTGVSGGTITEVEIDVPAGWTGLSAGNISLSGSGVNGVTASVSGSTIQLSGVALTDTDTITVSVTGLTSPNPVNVSDDGSYTFTTRTAESGGTLMEVATSPTVLVTIPLANLHDNDADGVPNLLGSEVAVEAVATFGGSFTSGALNTFLEDSSGGVNIFLGGGSPLTEGNAYIVAGTVGQFNGLTQVNPAAETDIVDLGSSTAIAPQAVTLAALLANPEDFEGELVTISNVVIDSSSPTQAFPVEGDNAFDIVITDDGGTSLFTLVVDADTDVDGMTTPAGAFTVTGILSQFDSSSPRTEGYQIVPRYRTDVVVGTATVPEINIQGQGTTIIDGSTTPQTADDTDFGDVDTAGGSDSHTFTIENNGTADLTISSIDVGGANSSDFTIGSFSDNTTIAAGETATFTVTFDPSADGVREAVITVNNDDADEAAYDFAVQGTGTTTPSGPTVWLNEIHYDNASGDVNEFVEVAGVAGTDLTGYSVVLYNGSNGTSYATLSLNGTIDDEGSGYGAVDVDGPSAGIQNGAPDGFALVDDSGTVIEFLSYEGSFTATDGPANGMTSVDIGVAETGSTAIGESLQRDNSVLDSPGGWSGPGDDSPGTLNVTVAAGDPEINIQGQSNDISDGSTTPLTSDDTDFGNIDTAGGSDTHTFTIQNTGTSVLTVYSIVAGGVNSDDFTVGGFTGNTEVAAGESTTFTITFDPEADGLREAEISIYSDDADESPYNFSVQGTGTTTPSGPTVWLNEIHYDNDGGDVGEFVEVAGIAGTDLSGYTVVLYNGNNGERYATISLSGTIDDEGSGYGARDFYRSGIQNGNPDGFALVDNNGVLIEFLSYGGTMTASGGPADGVTSTDIGVSETTTTPEGQSLQRDNSVLDSPGGWSGPITATGGSLNIAAPSAPEIDVEGNSASITSGDATPDTADHTDFGTTPTGTPVSRTFTIQNEGTSDLTLSGGPDFVSLSGADAGLFSITNQPSGATIAPGGSLTFTVQYKPSAAGTHTATISLSSDDSDEGTYSFDISGTATQVEIDVTGNGNSIEDGDATPDLADDTNFGSVSVGGANIVKTFTVTNEGTGILNLTDPVSISGTGASQFSAGTLSATSLAAGESATFTVTYTAASDAATHTAEISLTNTDSDENPYNFTVTAETVAPEIGVSGNATDITDGDTTPETGDDTDFGTVQVGGSSIVKTFTVTNSGTDTLTLTDPATLTGSGASQFSVGSLSSTSLASGESATFTVTYSASATAASHDAVVSLVSNDVDENPFTFAITGETIAPEIEVSGNGSNIVDGDTTPDTGDDTDFGAVGVGGSAIVKTFTVTNAGTDTLTLSQPIVGGAGAGQFSVGTISSTTLTVGQTATFTVTYSPDATAAIHTAEVSIANSDADENPFNFAITAETIAPEIAVTGNSNNIVDGDATPDSADDTDFGAVDAGGGNIVKTFTVTNSGTDTLTLNEPTVSGSGAAQFTVGALSSTSLAPNATATFTVTYAAGSVAATHVAEISLISNDADESPYTFAITAETVDPEIDVSGNGNAITDGDISADVTDDTDFGNVDTDSGSDTHTYSIRNTGTADLDISSIIVSGANSGDFTIGGFTPGSTVAPGSSTTFTVTFDPSADGLRTATVSINSNDADESVFDFAVQGTGVSIANVYFNEFHYDNDGADDGEFVEIAGDAGTDLTGWTIELYNGSNGTVYDTIALSGTIDNESGGLGAVSFSPPGSMQNGAPDGMALIDNNGNVLEFISYEGTLTATEGSANGLTSVDVGVSQDGDPEGSSIHRLSNTGGGEWTTTLVNTAGDLNAEAVPEIEIEGNGIEIVDGDVIPSTTDDTDFGESVVGGSGVVRTFTINNTGIADLTVSTIEITGVNSGDFTLGGFTPGVVVPSGSSTTFTVTFDPSAEGIKSATVTVNSNDGDEASYDFSIEGTGTSPEINITGNNQVIADGDTTPDVGDGSDFGTVDTVSGSETSTFVIQNTGAAPLLVTTISLGGAAAGDFSITGFTPNTTVNPGESISVDVTFDPAADGLREATLTINSDDADEAAYTFALAGTGVTAPLTTVINGPAAVDEGDPITYTIDFGEDVSGFVETDIVVGNGNVDQFTDNNDGSFTVVVTPSGTGDVTVNIPDGAADSDAGRGGNVAASFTTTQTASVVVNNQNQQQYQGMQSLFRDLSDNTIFSGFRSSSIFSNGQQSGGFSGSDQLLSFEPFFAGSGSLGANVRIMILDGSGVQVGSVSTVADMAGNWSAVLGGGLSGSNYQIVVEQTVASWLGEEERTIQTSFTGASLAPPSLSQLSRTGQIFGEILEGSPTQLEFEEVIGD